MNTLENSIIQFELPAHLSCPQPTEERGLLRDEVRLMITTGSATVHHSTFDKVDEHLQSGDVLVVNTSATVPAALPVTLSPGRIGVAHFSTHLDKNEWLVEIREVTGNKTIRWKDGKEGLIFYLPEDAALILKKRFYNNQQWVNLWAAEFITRQPNKKYMIKHGRPIKYEGLEKEYPLSFYQTMFSFHEGSSEMPSAGRAFTPTLVEKLVKKGIVFAPILLHTGVSSLEENETPYPEYMEVDPLTASIINAGKKQGNRIIAVGTTAIRAIETAAAGSRTVQPYRGNTALFIREDYTMRVTDGLLTGFHEPRASHLNILQSLAGYEHIQHAYKAAIKSEYYWHQFGDLHLILL